jgi:hypothetical protein
VDGTSGSNRTSSSPNITDVELIRAYQFATEVTRAAQPQRQFFGADLDRVLFYIGAAVTSAHGAKFISKEEAIMHAVVRTYSGKGAKELFDVLEKRKADVEKLMRSVKGFVSYSLVRTKDGGFTVTIAQDKGGVDESIQKARDWVKENASTGSNPPTISEGSVILQLK